MSSILDELEKSKEQLVEEITELGWDIDLQEPQPELIRLIEEMEYNRRRRDRSDIATEAIMNTILTLLKGVFIAGGIFLFLYLITGVGPLNDMLPIIIVGFIIYFLFIRNSPTRRRYF